MLNILDFPDGLSNDIKLQDGTWQYATVCDLSTDSVFWNRAAFITLPKDYATEASSAALPASKGG